MPAARLMDPRRETLTPLLPETLSADFSPAQEITRRTLRCLCSILIDGENSPSIQSGYKEWSQLFSIATEYDRQKSRLGEQAGLQKSLRSLGMEVKEGNFGRLIFATHTFFAIIAKWMALASVTDEPPESWPGLTEAELAAKFGELESGSLFRRAGLHGFLEGDLFGWYAQHSTPGLLDCLREVVIRLARYDFSAIRSGDESSRDLLKALYLRLVSPAVRKTLGEYYTPDWLAQRLLDLVKGPEAQGGPDSRLLDPACGSGTFLVLAIKAVRNDPRSRLMKPSELLRKICRNIVGVDLNPLAVMAARANYLLALGPLWPHRGEAALEIPVFLGDSIRMPSLLPTWRGGSEEALPTAVAAACRSPFDYVVGNPPWIGWENLPEEYRRLTRQLWHEHGLFVHRGMDTILGKGKKDLSMLMTYVAAEHYLKAGGRLGFVITQAVFKMSGAGEGFRRFLTRSKTPLQCERVEDYSALQLFEGANTRTALFVLNKGQQQSYPTPYAVFRKGLAGVVPHDWLAEPSDPAAPTSSWLTGSPALLQASRKVLGRSDYKAHQGVNTGGANAVYWFEIVAEDGPDGVIARNLIGAAKRKIKAQLVPLEKCRLFPLLRGHDVTAWRAKPSAWLLFVQDPQSRRGVSPIEMAGTPKTLHWLEQNKPLLLERAAYKRFYEPSRAPFWSMFDVGSYTVKPWKVVWPRMAARLEAAVVGTAHERQVLAQETCSLVGLDDEAEAFYLAGAINSTPLRFTVSAFSQPGSKSFGTPSILEKARIPHFDASSQLHREISLEARRLSSGGPAAGDEIHEQLDALCRHLWGVSEKELQSLQQGRSIGL